MTDTCALDPPIAMSLVQLAQDGDTSKKLNSDKKRSFISAHCNGTLHVPRLHRCLEKSINNYSLFRLKTKTNAALNLTK